MKRKAKRTTQSNNCVSGIQEYQLGWTRQEAGWYTHEKLGGICHETSWEGWHVFPIGWYYYPNGASGLGIEKHGPYKTLLAAQQAAAELAKGGTA